MKKVDLVVGARPNFIKAFPVYHALKKTRRFKLRLINTGQHYDKNMSDIFFRQLKMKEPDVDLVVGGVSHSEQTGKIAWVKDGEITNNVNFEYLEKLLQKEFK